MIQAVIDNRNLRWDANKLRSNGFSLRLTICMVGDHNPDAIYSVNELGVIESSFVVASNNKELKTLMTSDADVVYDADNGKCSSTTTARLRAGVPRSWVGCSPGSKASLS